MALLARRTPRELVAAATVLTALLLVLAMVTVGPGVQRSVLYSMDDSGMQGPQYIPEVNQGFPRPWDQPSGHPSLSSVQYMPSNSTVCPCPLLSADVFRAASLSRLRLELGKGV